MSSYYSGLALQTDLVRTGKNAAAPVDILMGDLSRNNYAATYNGSAITVGQLPSNVWYQEFPNTTPDDYVIYSGMVDEGWHPWWFECWFYECSAPVAGTTTRYLMTRHTAGKTGFVIYRASNVISSWFEDNAGTTSTALSLAALTALRATSNASRS